MAKEVHTKEEFDDVLKSTKVLVVVDFYATWCGPCKFITPKLEEIAKEKGDKIVVIKVDVDENEDLSKSLGVSAMPTFHLYKNGQKVEEMIGANYEKLQDLIEKYIE